MPNPISAVAKVDMPNPSAVAKVNMPNPSAVAKVSLNCFKISLKDKLLVYCKYKELP